MYILTAKQIQDSTHNILHAETQVHEDHLDLSVKAIYRPVEVGTLDFGGSEFNAAGFETMRAIKQNESDSYGWWNLQEGDYQAAFNETLLRKKGKLTLISLHEHAIQAGLMGTSRMIAGNSESVLRLNFRVPSCGCNIKENARLATAVILQE